MSTSFIGLRGKQEIGDNLYAVFNLQTLFNPACGMNANGTATIAQNNGLPFNALQNSFGNSSKGGQMFNNAAYFGLSSPTYGTFTMGRQSALTSDLVVNYDPLSGSNSWSVITFQGANGGGGDTENRIYDNSYEYRVNVGPVRFAAEVQAKNGGNSGTGNAFEGNIGFDYMGFSLDFVGGKIFDAVGSSPLGLGIGVNPAVAIGNGQLTATVSDDTVFQCRRPLHDRAVEVVRWLRAHQLLQPEQPAAAGRLPPGRLHCRCGEQPRLPVRQDPANGVVRCSLRDHAGSRHHRRLLPRVG